MANRPRIIVGLDYGTTYTGVAYIDVIGNNHGRSHNDIQLIQNWGGHGTDEKVPSQIAYGKDGVVTWGNLIPQRATGRKFWTKLQLDERNKSSERSEEFRRLISFLQRMGIADGLGDDDGGEDGPPEYPGKEPVDIVADYLTFIRERLMEALSSRFGVALNTIPMELVVTVPAVWSDKAKDLTFKAVTKAGFKTDQMKISMVAEPEAAALWTMRSMAESALVSAIKVNDNFVICDAGGGTVDLISYRIRAIKPDLEVEECAVGTGDKCGATFVDQEFISWLKEKLGDQYFNKIPADQREIGSKLMKEFNTAKMAFRNENDDYYVSLPRAVGIDDDLGRGIQDGEIIITSSDMREIFDPSINRALELIDGQIAEVMNRNNVVKNVILVGGFGRSDYMYQRVQEYCQERGLGALRPMFPWSAVVRGAVIYGMNPDNKGMVKKRMCRMHYGTPISELFDPTKHEPDQGFIDDDTGLKFARDEQAICVLHADLTDIPESKFTKATRGTGGGVFFVASFKIEITIRGNLLDFALLFDGERKGSVEAKYT
ncbi:hypothetical protein FGG08_000471 [Glutinoglossum americanum]|uniref:Actin-like ATPase domain-containing protein n=1 Tax=Glutinoglossum americanum TaxID=1670608 RepID=A0A9P8ICY0_9PEZI|nr:hypothetical protein FGG08_000471 [Glutinoglossum americanum]